MRQLFRYISYFTAAATAITLIASVAVSNYKAKEDRRTIIQSQAKQRVTDSIALSEIVNIRSEIGIVKGIVNSHTESLDNLNKAFISHLKNDKRFDELINYLQSSQNENTNKSDILNKILKKTIDTIPLKIKVTPIK